MTGALTAPGFDLDCKLALHSLVQDCALHRADTLPLAEGLPVVLRLGREGTTLALVVADSTEAVPGPSWGKGSRAPLLVGPAPEIEIGPSLSADRLIELGTGNARTRGPV